MFGATWHVLFKVISCREPGLGTPAIHTWASLCLQTKVLFWKSEGSIFDFTTDLSLECHSSRRCHCFYTRGRKKFWSDQRHTSKGCDILCKERDKENGKAVWFACYVKPHVTRQVCVWDIGTAHTDRNDKIVMCSLLTRVGQSCVCVCVLTSGQVSELHLTGQLNHIALLKK